MIDRKVVVIGAGFGGLALAVRLQAAGVQTVLLERRDKPGGRAYVYEDEGFTFDAGPTVITAPDCLEELYTLASRDIRDYIELIPIDPMYRLRWEDGHELNYARSRPHERANRAPRPARRRWLPAVPRVLARGLRGGLREAGGDAISEFFEHDSRRTAAHPAGKLSLGVQHRQAIYSRSAATPGA